LAFSGNNNLIVAKDFDNLANAYGLKGEYDRAIAYFEKALDINSVVFGNKHPSIATYLNILGFLWQAKGDYDRAITYFEKCKEVVVSFFEPQHPYRIATIQNLSNAANTRGMEFFQKQQYVEALPYFQKALDNAEATEDWAFSLMCLNNIGGSHKRLSHYAEGLAALEKGIARAQELDQKLGKPEHVTRLRRMRYHSAGCLAGLGRKQEADALYQQLLKEARQTNDTRLLEDLKNDGVKG